MHKASDDPVHDWMGRLGQTWSPAKGSRGSPPEVGGGPHELPDDARRRGTPPDMSCQQADLSAASRDGSSDFVDGSNGSGDPSNSSNDASTDTSTRSFTESDESTDKEDGGDMAHQPATTCQLCKTVATSRACDATTDHSYEAGPPETAGPAGCRREWLDFRGYVDSETMRQFGTKKLTQRVNITCFRCGEQGHYRIECLSWRTKMCLHYARPSGCREGDNCSYAHSEAELRSPWHAKCVRVIKRHGQIFTLGCHSNSHTFKMCPQMSCVVCGSRRHWTCDQTLL